MMSSRKQGSCSTSGKRQCLEGGEKSALREFCMHGVLSEVYLQNPFHISGTLRDDSNEHN
jgi:hypothetical protein